MGGKAVVEEEKNEGEEGVSVSSDEGPRRLDGGGGLWLVAREKGRKVERGRSAHGGHTHAAQAKKRAERRAAIAK